MSRERLRTFYLGGWVMGLLGCFSSAVGAGMALASATALEQALGALILLLGLGLMVIGLIGMGIALISGYQRAARESGRKWLSGWELTRYLLDGDEPRRRSRR